MVLAELSSALQIYLLPRELRRSHTRTACEAIVAINSTQTVNQIQLQPQQQLVIIDGRLNEKFLAVNALEFKAMCYVQIDFQKG